MDAILFSADLRMVNIKAAINHLKINDKLYWEVGFRINPKRFVYPMFGYIHICGQKVKYRVIIGDIIDFSRSHYEDKELVRLVKPTEWIEEWESNKDNIRDYHWRSVFVMKCIEPLSFDTFKFHKVEGGLVTIAPQSYVRVKNPLLHLSI